jgi:hypothetical protein
MDDGGSRGPPVDEGGDLLGCPEAYAVAGKISHSENDPHHCRQLSPRNGAGTEPGDADRGRGASALKDAARLVYTLNVMTKDEAKGFGIRGRGPLGLCANG